MRFQDPSDLFRYTPYIGLNYKRFTLPTLFNRVPSLRFPHCFPYLNSASNFLNEMFRVVVGVILIYCVFDRLMKEDAHLPKATVFPKI